VREFKREFFGIWADSANLGYIHRANSIACSEIPGATVREFFRPLAGILGRAAGIFPQERLFAFGRGILAKGSMLSFGTTPIRTM
jgi:hypothetical protein